MPQPPPPPTHPVAIAEYQAENPLRYYYTPSTVALPPDMKDEWTRTLAAGGFLVYLPESTDGTEIYEYRADNPLRFSYSANPNLSHGWTRVKVAFRSMTQDPRRADVYQYHAEDPWRYFYSTNRNSPPAEGWVNDGVAFQAQAIR
jgi:hypothetical protein